MSVTSPNIIWITIDSVRADHTSLHGYERTTTPNLSQIASSTGGIKFNHGIAHSTRTPVSVPSMLTGLYPSRHQMIGTSSGDVPPPAMKTVPELLSDIGYHTIGISENGYAGPAKDLDERFDDFVKSSPSSLMDFLSFHHGMSLVKYLPQMRRHGPGLTLDVKDHGQSNAFFTTDIAKRKLRDLSAEDAPNFTYIHYNDPHHPYIPPITYCGQFLDEINATIDEAAAVAQQMHDELYRWMAGDLPLSTQEWDILHAMYDASIRYTDEMVGNLFSFIQEQLGPTIVVITADHGDLFGEYGLLGHHMVLHDGLVHVPLITHGLDDVADHAKRPTQHIDVMQTCLEIAGADTTQFQGYDLRSEQREVAISQDLRGSVEDDSVENYERIRQYNTEIDLSHLPQSMISSFRTTDYKLVQTDEWTRLYELPDETTDVSDEHPEIRNKLRTFADEWMTTRGTPHEEAPDEANLSRTTEEHLRNMGYL